MKLENMSKEELELLSYTDLTELILKDQKKPATTPAVFRIICDLLEYTDEEYADKIGDYYTSLTIDKRFVFLETNEWDLREKHSMKSLLDDEELEDDEIDEEELDEEVDENADSENIDEIDDNDDDLDDLAVLSEEELED